jgi:hypothetical protein
MPNDGDRRKQESEKNRDGKKNKHASVRRITRGKGSCTFFDQPTVWLDSSVLTKISLQGYESGTLLREGGFPLDAR